MLYEFMKSKPSILTKYIIGLSRNKRISILKRKLFLKQSNNCIQFDFLQKINTKH